MFAYSLSLAICHNSNQVKAIRYREREMKNGNKLATKEPESMNERVVRVALEDAASLWSRRKRLVAAKIGKRMKPPTEPIVASANITKKRIRAHCDNRITVE